MAVAQVLSPLREAVHGGEIFQNVARTRLAYLGQLRMRLLGDAVLPKVAWEAADGLRSASTYDAEYIALTRLQADALITLNRGLARVAEKLVAVAPPLERSSGPDPLAAV